MANYGGDALCKINTTIASGASLSSSTSLQSNSTTYCGLRFFGFDVPATWTAASITVYNKHSDGTYKPVKDETGSEFTIPTVAGDQIRFSNPAQFSSLDDVKLLSGTTATPVSQEGDRVITFILRSI